TRFAAVRRFQNASLSTTTRVSGTASAVRKVRPVTGATRSTSKNSEATACARNFSGAPNGVDSVTLAPATACRARRSWPLDLVPGQSARVGRLQSGFRVSFDGPADHADPLLLLLQWCLGRHDPRCAARCRA